MFKNLTPNQKRLFVNRLIECALIVLLLAEAYVAVRLFLLNWQLAMNENLRYVKDAQEMYTAKYESLQAAKAGFRSGNAIAALTFGWRFVMYFATATATFIVHRKCTILTQKIRRDLANKRRARRIVVTRNIA